MQSKEIIEGNKLIAEFMGGKFYVDTPTILEKHIVSPSGGAIKCVDKLKYHSSWDWLMTVVEKIHKIAVSPNSINKITENIIFTFSIFAPKQDVWQAAVQFIQWYNSQTPQP